MQVFLTGISGYLGGVLADYFSSVPEIERVTGIDVIPPKRPLPNKARLVQIDIRSPALASLVKGHDVVVHTSVERMLTETLVPAGVTLTMFRPGYVIGPRNSATIESLRANSVRLSGHDPRSQYIHEQDVAAAFTKAVLTEMPGACNLDPDDCLRLSEVQKIVGIEFAPTVPVWLARLIMYISWKYLGSPTHPSWLDVMLVDFTLSNMKLKAEGWKPRYDSAEATRSALGS